MTQEPAHASRPVEELFEVLADRVEELTAGEQRPFVECHTREVTRVVQDGGLRLVPPSTPAPTFMARSMDCTGDMAFRGGVLYDQ